MSNDTESAVASMCARVSGGLIPWRGAVSRLPFSKMEEVLMGSVWELLRPLLAADDTVKLRIAARCWNVGDKYGPYGEVMFTMLKKEQFERHWHYDPRDKRELCSGSGIRSWTVSANWGSILFRTM